MPSIDVTIAQSRALQGTVTVPADKAICHRALLAAAVAAGTTQIGPWPEADDCQRTLELVERLGAAVTRSGTSVSIGGCGRDGLRAPAEPLWCGESGTTLRLAAGLLAGQPFPATLTAGPSLSARPMRRIVEPLSAMGAQLDGRSGGGREIHPPVTIHGRRPLRAIRYEMPVASAQVKSAILLAGLFADGPTSVIERSATRDHTERMLRHFGARLAQHDRQVVVEPGALASPGILTLPGDFSSAAFFLIAAACVPGSRLEVAGVGLNPTRAGALDVLRRMGARVRTSVMTEGWEPVGTVEIASSPLRGVTVTAQEAPGVIDELPALLVAAACAAGVSRFEGVGELRVKEADRIRSMVDGLGRLGARIRAVADDAIEVDGGRLRGAVVQSAGDHRTAMSLAVAGLAAEGTTVVEDAACVTKSFPDFFDRLRSVAGAATVKTVDNS